MRVGGGLPCFPPVPSATSSSVHRRCRPLRRASLRARGPPVRVEEGRVTRSPPRAAPPRPTRRGLTFTAPDGARPVRYAVVPPARSAEATTYLPPWAASRPRPARDLPCEARLPRASLPPATRSERGERTATMNTGNDDIRAHPAWPRQRRVARRPSRARPACPKTWVHQKPQDGRKAAAEGGRRGRRVTTFPRLILRPCLAGQRARGRRRPARAARQRCFVLLGTSKLKIDG